jgi:hypothetical protein
MKSLFQPTIYFLWRGALAALFMVCGAQVYAIDALVKTDNVAARLAAEHNVVQLTAAPADHAGVKNYVRAAPGDLAAERPVATSVSQPHGCSVKYAS